MLLYIPCVAYRCESILEALGAEWHPLSYDCLKPVMLY